MFGMSILWVLGGSKSSSKTAYTARDDAAMGVFGSDTEIGRLVAACPWLSGGITRSLRPALHFCMAPGGWKPSCEL